MQTNIHPSLLSSYIDHLPHHGLLISFFPLVFSSVLYFLFLFLSSPFLFSATAIDATPDHQTCVDDHFTALLDLKQGFDFNYTDKNLSSWDKDNRDCSSWEGITCNTHTGHVIALNLSWSFLSGSFHFESLFRLSSLQRLDLSVKFFYGSIPSGFHQLPGLTHLHLSHCYFTGQIPLDIFHLTRLVSLDLSYNNAHCLLYLHDCAALTLKSPGMSGLLRNLSSLRELSLDLADLSSEGIQWSEALSYASPLLQKLSFELLSSFRTHPSSPIPPWSYYSFGSQWKPSLLSSATTHSQFHLPNIF